MFKYFLILVLLVLICVSCHDGCVAEETRCSGNRVMICDAEQDWHLVMNCSTVDPVEWDWTCCEVDAGHSCIPEEECTGGDQ